MAGREALKVGSNESLGWILESVYWMELGWNCCVSQAGRGCFVAVLLRYCPAHALGFFHVHVTWIFLVGGSFMILSSSSMTTSSMSQTYWYQTQCSLYKQWMESSFVVLGCDDEGRENINKTTPLASRSRFRQSANIF